MESLLAEFLPDLLILFPPHRDYSLVLKLLIHPPDSNCSLHPPSYSAGSLASRGLHSSGRNRKRGAVSAGTEAGDSVIWKREKRQRPHCKQGRVWRGVESSWKKQMDTDFTVWRGPKNMFWTEERACTRTSEDRGTMANKRVYRDQGWLYVCSKRLQIQRVEEVISIALNLISLTLPASSRESLKGSKKKTYWDYFHFRQIIRVKEKTGEVEKTILDIQEDPSWKVSRNWWKGWVLQMKQAQRG